MPKIISTSTPIVPPRYGGEVGYEYDPIELLAVDGEALYYYSLPDSVEVENLGDQEVRILTAKEEAIAREQVGFAETAAEFAAKQDERSRASKQSSAISLLEMIWRSMHYGEIQRSKEFYQAMLPVMKKFPGKDGLGEGREWEGPQGPPDEPPDNTGERIILSGAHKLTIKRLGTYGKGSDKNYKMTVRMTVALLDDSVVNIDPFGDFDDWNTGDISKAKGVDPHDGERVFPEGSSVEIFGRSWKWDGDDYIELHTVGSNSEYAVVLRNGDSVPDIPAFASMKDVTKYLRSHLDQSASPMIVHGLADNEYLCLFELHVLEPADAEYTLQNMAILLATV